jgi:predicted enzyme related to lactoylglutathione lyase
MEEERETGKGTALETAIIFTGRLEELARFYQEGLELGGFNRSPRHLGLQVGPVYLGFDQVEQVRGGGGVTLWFTVDDLRSTYERLVLMGAGVVYPPSRKAGGAFLAAVYDPDGNMIGLSQRGGVDGAAD